MIFYKCKYCMIQKYFKNNILLNLLRSSRRFILKKIIPEFIWQKYIDLNGVSIPIKNMPFSFGIKLLLCSGDYEYPERTLISLIIKRGMNVIEMGTSIGILTAIVAQKIGVNGKIVTVEASTKKYNISKSWLLKIFPNIKLLNGFAFPCKEYPEDITINNFDDSTNSLGGKLNFSIKNQGDSIDFSKKSKKNKKNINLQKFDIDTIEKSFLNKSADLLISDVEGAETIILNSFCPFPETLKYIVIELHPFDYNSDKTEEKIINKIIASNFLLKMKIENSYLFIKNKTC